MMEKTYIDVNSGDEVVISGIAGRFPDSDNMNQFRENLFNKVDLVRANHRRWDIEHPDLPERMGTVNDVEKFDADFFNVSVKQAHTLDPMARLLLEHSYEAIVDAGINPMQMRGRKTAVIVGMTVLESQEKFMYENLETDGMGILGCSKSTMANVISCCLDLKGPSYTVDTACSSSLYAMALGYRDIISGRCEDAIIGTAHLCLHPIINLNFSRLGILSADGTCRPFDSESSGYSRSEAVSVIYLQKAKNAKRIYATCKHIKVNNDGYKEEGITFPSTHMQSVLMMECYKECGISPSYLDYMEAHGTGTKVGDPEEVNAIHNVLCKGRKIPLMIGSVKSNMGHAEPASGFTQIAKIITAFETGFIPPNINITSPRDDIDAFANGTIRVLTRPLPLKNGYISINSFGFGGCNAHLLLKWHIKQKVNNGAPNDDLPRLVTLSGRTKESVNSFLNDVANHAADAEYIRLLHDVHVEDIKGHPWRGYVVLDTYEQNFIREIQNYDNVKRPVCFVFSALGSQWPGMGQSLIQFYAFANAVRMCDAILKPYNINIMKILTKKHENACENALHTFVGIIAVQIGLVDLLTSLDIIPDYIISHSAGELGCAYADKCLTLEQTILSAYFIGLACVEENIIDSSMAIVDLDYESLKHTCPEDIEIICYNSRNSNVITGPVESMQEFMEKLQTSNVNVKEIACDVPYHSIRYLASLETRISFNLNEVISQPKKRSPRWISTSVPCIESNGESKLSSASYHKHSILNTVLFDQATRLIPNNAVVIEIAPDSVLRSILKESLGPKITNVSLTDRTRQNTIDEILREIGRLYNCGLQPHIANLYPPVEFPVSRGTPMIAPSIRWDHSVDWYTISYQSQKTIKSGERLVEVTLEDEIYSYMSGYIIDGKNLLPGIGYLALVWETIGMMKGEMYTTMPIVFKDISFIRATHLSDNVVKLMVTIQKGSGKFEVTEGDSLVVTGTVYAPSNPRQETIPIELLPEDDDEEENMTDRDIYKELKLRGYQYSGYFCGLKSASISGNKGHIVWANNWVTYVETMLQLHTLGHNTEDLYVSTGIEKLVIDPVLHTSKLRNIVEEDKQLPVRIYREIDAIISGGIEIRGTKSIMISRRKLLQDPVIEEYTFVPHHDCAKISLDEAIQISAQLALEDHQIIKVKAIELVEDDDDVTLENLSSSLLIKTFDNMPLIQTNITLVTSPNRFNSAELSENITIASLNKLSVNDKVLIVSGFNLLTKPNNWIERLLPFVTEGGYLLTRENNCNIIDYEKHLRQYKLNVILEKRTDTEIILLLKKKVPITKMAVVHINNHDFNWLEHLKLLVSVENQLKNSRIIIVGEGDFECGLLGFINCLRKESGGEFVRGVLIQDQEAPKFSLQDLFYTQQLQKDMTVNVLRPNKTWGSYRHLQLSSLEAKPVSTAYVCQMVHGDLSTLCWMENNISIDSHREDLVRVIYSSINSRDVMVATAKANSMSMSQDRFERTSLGMEYAGFDADGRRVMGLRNNKCIANIVVKDRDLCWNIPDTWTFEEAATVPYVYSKCYLALYIYGKMKKGDKVLVHSGTEDIGQAAIHLALNEGCEVFTTVDTNEKREFIKKTFPTIVNEHIGNSQDISFEQMIMLQTNGRGVDIVLNSLTGEKLIASVYCLAQNGCFLEIGEFNLASNNPLDMTVFRKNISFYKILLDNIFVDYHKNKSLLSKMMADGLKNGAIKPIHMKVFEKTELETAFRYMTSGNNLGKTILKIQEDKPTNELILAHRRYYCLSDRSYIILGGLGGLGLELTDWLIQRGARNVVLISRTGIKNGYQRMKIQLWKSYGVNVHIVKDIDVADSNDCEFLLKTAEKEAPVDGIFNLAMVLHDRIVKNHVAETFAKSFKSKAWATQMLDKLSRKICPKLRHFVVFSSVSCGRGNAGQSNYGMTNSVMERICEKRVEDGLPGLAIQWGAMGDVGLVADMQEDNKVLTVVGTTQQKLNSALNELDKFLVQDRPVVSSMVLAEKKVTSSGDSNMVETVANILNIKDTKKMSKNTSLAELGMESMMAMEIKQTLEREFDVFFTVQEIRNLTFAKLCEMSDAIKEAIIEEEMEQQNMQQAALMRKRKSIDTRTPITTLFNIVKDEDFRPDVCFDLSRKEKSTAHVFLIPGIDGCGTVFNHLASNVKFSMTILQYTIDNIDASNIVLETVNYLLKHVLARLKSGRDFVMVGYSFGSIIAIELARRLESMNFKGRLILIDGAPEQVQILHEHYMPTSNDIELQTGVLNTITDTYKAAISGKVLAELKKCETWEERFNLFAKHFLAVNTLLSPTNLKTLCTTMYKYAVAIRQYDSSTQPRIKSSIMLLKPTLSQVYNIEEDYGLDKITENKVEIYYLKGNRLTILKNEKVTVAINGENMM